MNLSVVPNPTLTIRRIDDEVFLFDRNNNRIHSFNETGTLLWNLLERDGTVDTETLAGALTEHFDVDVQTARRDVAQFVESLRHHSLVKKQ